MIEICSGLGAVCGPLLGAFFYMVFGYMGPFECIGGMYALFILYFLKKKSSIKFSQDFISDENQNDDHEEELIKMSLFEIISIARSGFGLLV